MDTLDTISLRRSVRSYESEPAPAAELEQVRAAGGAAEALTPVDMRFELRPHAEIGRKLSGILGDYGKIIRAPHYVVLAAREADDYLVDAGFRFEQMILAATRMGLGTCWVGGFFRESTMRHELGLDESWRIVALTPIGRPSGKSLLDRAIHGLARSSKRRALDELFFWERHGRPLPPEVLNDDVALMRVLEATRWAPSWANKQPWRFVLSQPGVLLYKLADQVKEGKDYHLVDCGIAMAHLHLAAQAVGIGGRWTLGASSIPGAPQAQPVGRYQWHGAIADGRA